MGLLGTLRVRRGKVVVANDDLLVGANRTTGSVLALNHSCWPGVALVANPLPTLRRPRGHRGWVPAECLCGKSWVVTRQVIETDEDSTVRTDGAAVSPRSIRWRCVPDVPERADPVTAFSRLCRQGRRVPAVSLSGESGIRRCQIVETGPHGLTGTEWTPGPFASFDHSSLPSVAEGAAPAHFLGRVGPQRRRVPVVSLIREFGVRV